MPITVYIIGGLGVAGAILFLLWRGAVKGREVEIQKRAKVEVDRDAWRQVNAINEELKDEVRKDTQRDLTLERARLLKRLDDAKPGKIIKNPRGMRGGGA